MRQRHLLVAFLLVVQAAAFAEEDRPNPLKVLFIGNSNTAVNDLPGMIEALADAAGGRGMRVPKPADFDVRCQHQATGLQGGLNGAYFDIANELGAKVAPVGIAWQKALATDPPFVLHRLDKSHPNPKGTYLTAWESVAEMNGSEPLDGANSIGVTAVRMDASPEPALQQVAETKGLVAFWDFTWMQDGKWTSRHDDHVVDGGYPVVIRRIGDPKSYTPDDWPYTDEQSKLVFDSSGPFGHAVRFNQGYIFAEVPRHAFDRSPLDIHGRQPFTLIAWIKFIGKRHLVAGIWDEGGWDKYGGRRQIALFGGLFGSQGVIGHVSTTGASSYPQSTLSGSQYARCRAIDGRGFENDRWVAMAMTFDPAAEQVTVYCDGVATPTQITDPVAKDVFRYKEPVASNPYRFPWPVYSPRSFVLKFNGYNLQSSNISEHWLDVDAESGTVAYDRSDSDLEEATKEYRVVFDVGKGGGKLDAEPIIFEAVRKKVVTLPKHMVLTTDREIVTSLEFHEDGEWKRVGRQVRYRIREGAPFTFGRALGLGTEPIDHGTQVFIDGVAVFNRVLSNEELMELSFTAR